MSGGEAPQFHQLATEGQTQAPRPEREGEEHRRGRRNRGGRDRNRGDRPREDRPREEHSPAAAALAEQQRRIHELESRAEQTPHEEPQQQPQPRYEPPAPPPVEQPRAEQRRVEEPRTEEPRIDAKQLLNDSGLVMIETDRAKVTVQPQVVEEAQPAGRPRRERPKPAPQDDELQQVETRK